MKETITMAVHGGEVFRLAAQAGIDPENIIDFSANINPLGLPPGVDKAMRESLKTLANYPEIGAESLRRCVAKRHNLQTDNVVVGNGSSALIYLLARVLKPQKALIWAPTFTEYERALSQVQCQVSNLNIWDPNKQSSLDEIIKSSIAMQPDLVFICNPNNPTGALWSIMELEKIVSAYQKVGIICVLDEAFIDFVGIESSFADHVNDYDNLIVLRSLTKIYALAGLRCGYLLSGRSINRLLSRFLEPWSINSLALKAAIAALENDQEFIKQTISFVGEQRDYLYRELLEISFLRPFPSHANYILAKLENGIDGEKVRRYLFSQEKILIRLCGDYVGLGQNYLRFAVKGGEDNRRLIKTLQRFKAIS
ncbi:MAG: threonine-phosphate decarboxylase CobD [Pseudomonadota bacterium]|nr:threonine-phosphate decarboxylase CobD [Pseudomonadota bacterium]